MSKVLLFLVASSLLIATSLAVECTKCTKASSLSDCTEKETCDGKCYRETKRTVKNEASSSQGEGSVTYEYTLGCEASCQEKAESQTSGQAGSSLSGTTTYESKICCSEDMCNKKQPDLKTCYRCNSLTDSNCGMTIEDTSKTRTTQCYGGCYKSYFKAKAAVNGVAARSEYYQRGCSESCPKNDDGDSWCCDEEKCNSATYASAGKVLIVTTVSLLMALLH